MHLLFASSNRRKLMDPNAHDKVSLIMQAYDQLQIRLRGPWLSKHLP